MARFRIKNGRATNPPPYGSVTVRTVPCACAIANACVSQVTRHQLRTRPGDEMHASLIDPCSFVYFKWKRFLCAPRTSVYRAHTHEPLCCFARPCVAHTPPGNTRESRTTRAGGVCPSAPRAQFSSLGRIFLVACADVDQNNQAAVQH